MKFNDRVTVGQTKETAEGYLVATARVARTGVQLYYASELGDVAIAAGFSPTDIVRVNRPESEVFSKDTLTSITRIPVTVDHPEEEVTKDNWAKLSVGEVGDSYARDGEWIVVNPMVKDAAGIEAAKTTHREISMGYNAGIVPAADKTVADFDMVNIRMNHLALVAKGRAGSQARIGDSWGAEPITDNQPGLTPITAKGGHMSDQLKTVVLGDKAVQVAVSDVAAFEQFKADSAKAIADAESKHIAAIAAKDEELGQLKAELAEAKAAAVVDVDALVQARVELENTVKAIDSAIVPKGLSDAELRKAVVVAKLGEETVKDSSDAEISGMFKALALKVDANPAAQVFRQGVKVVGDSSAQMNDALAKSVDDLNAWRYQQ